MLMKSRLLLQFVCPMNKSVKKGEYDVLLTETRKERLDNNKKLEKGVLLHLSYEQLKTGGFLPILLAILGAVGATAGGAATVANSVISTKHQSAQEQEMKRHDREMETIAKNAKNLNWFKSYKKDEITLLSNFDIIKLAKDLKIKHFRGVFMKDELPPKANKVECGIINLENSDKEGSHWAAYYKNGDKKYYFNSYGNAPPPKELVKYLGPENLVYNSERFQNYDDPPICGHLGLTMLKKLSSGEKLQ